MDLDAITAIDVHTHVEVSAETGRGSLSPDLEAAADRYFGRAGIGRPTIPEMATHYRERSMAAVVFTVDARTNLGVEPIPNDEIAAAAAEHDDVLIPFASVDPHLGQAAVAEVHRLVEVHDVKGFKFHPSVQGFFPDDPMAYPVYDAIQSHGRIALFHTGQTGIGAGARGGAGIRLKYSNPIHLDDVAADFGDLDIIMAHPSVPWQDEAISVATHKPRVHIDLSGWSPKYFPPQLVQQARTRLQDKVLFGSDFPMITPDRWLADFERLDFPDDVREKVLKGNAARLLGLA
ncbi:amidohydrolase family protein [Euzebya sp.]|uniref:amidohydrolase family protein n=1 Tax=Euzebya sp. TaxID=1971409 RepID=UPI0035167788